MIEQESFFQESVHVKSSVRNMGNHGWSTVHIDVQSMNLNKLNFHWHFGKKSSKTDIHPKPANRFRNLSFFT